MPAYFTYDPDRSFCLRPYSRAEARNTKEACAFYGKAHATLKIHAERWGFGRMMPGGVWRFSICAMQMTLDGDLAALSEYLRGVRDGRVSWYFDLLGVPNLGLVASTARPVEPAKLIAPAYSGA